MAASPTLILSPRFTEDSIALGSAARRMGWRVQRLHAYRLPAELNTLTDAVLYGEMLFNEVIAEALGLTLIQPPMDWIAHVPAHYLKRHVHLTTLGEARAARIPQFVKPAEGKGFEARVYPEGSGLPAPDVWADDTPVIAAEIVQWEVEYRCFVAARALMAMSVYLRRGQLAQADDGTWAAPPDEMQDAQDFCRTLLADASLQLPAALVVDIGYISQRGWAVIEANPACAAGIYGCAPEAVLKVLQQACVRPDRVDE